MALDNILSIGCRLPSHNPCTVPRGALIRYMAELELTSVEEIKANFSQSQIDLWILAGYRAYIKARKSRKERGSRSKFKRADEVLKSLTRKDFLKLRASLAKK